MKKAVRIAITGFMGVGKSSVARHLSNLLSCRKVDLDGSIEEAQGRTVAEFIDAEGVNAYRKLESEILKKELERPGSVILSLGGGTWTVPHNRESIRNAGFTCIWLESSFEHCWYNIKYSRKDRPLARTKGAAIKLFEERQKDYCLADLHFIVKPEFNSYDIASQIVEEIF
jgi:shikimate kinase